MFQNPLQLGLLTALFGLAPIHAQEVVFTDRFEPLPVINQIDWGDEYEGEKDVFVEFCPREGETIQEANLAYSSGSATAETTVALLPKPDSTKPTTNPTCIWHQTELALALRYLTDTGDNGELDPNGIVDYVIEYLDSGGVSGSSSMLTKKLFMNEATFDTKLPHFIQTHPDYEVTLYDDGGGLGYNVMASINNVEDGPYDARLYTDVGINLNLEYNPGQYTLERMRELEAHITSVENGTGNSCDSDEVKCFREVSNSSIDDLEQFVDEVVYGPEYTSQ